MWQYLKLVLITALLGKWTPYSNYILPVRLSVHTSVYPSTNSFPDESGQTPPMYHS